MPDRKRKNYMNRHKMRDAASIASTPPDTLSPGQLIACVLKAEGKDLYTVETPESSQMLVELQDRFRRVIFVRNRGYVLIDTTTEASARENKIDGEIVSVIMNEQEWRKQPYWPTVFKERAVEEDSDEEDNVVGQMPPSDEDD
jgi:probable RNA-binding protein EIF1AD